VSGWGSGEAVLEKVRAGMRDAAPTVGVWCAGAIAGANHIPWFRWDLVEVWCLVVERLQLMGVVEGM